MKRTPHQQIPTAHGIATYHKRGNNYYYDITLDDKKISANRRRIRKSLGYVSEECIEEKIKLDIANRYKKLKRGIYIETNPIKYIQTTYIPHIQELTANHKQTDRGTWNPKKLRDDTTAITTYSL